MIISKTMKGSYTVELAAIMPVIMLVLVLAITSSFFMYDKCIMEGIAIEAAVTAAEELRYDEDLSVVQTNAENTAGKRLIFFEKGNVTVSKEKNRVTVAVWADKAIRGLQCNVSASACTVEPEKYIRISRTVSENQDE